jgi:hypothetical protein
MQQPSLHQTPARRGFFALLTLISTHLVLSFFPQKCEGNTSFLSRFLLLGGCTDPLAVNFNPLATDDDGSCIYDSANPEIQIVGSNNVCRGQEVSFVLTGMGSILPLSTIEVTFSDGSAPLTFSIANLPALNTITHVFNALSCGSNSPAGVTNAFGAQVVVSDFNGIPYLIFDSEPIFVSGAADFAQTGMFASPGSGPYCTNQTITFVNYGFGFFQALETGCVQNYDVTFSIAPDAAVVNALNTAIFPQYIEVVFPSQGQYAVSVEINGACPAAIETLDIAIGGVSGTVSLWVSDVDVFNPVPGMAVDLYTFGLQPQVFNSFSGFTNPGGSISFLNVPGGVYLARATPNLSGPQADLISTFSNEVMNWSAAHLIPVVCNSHFKDTIFMFKQTPPNPFGGAAQGRLTYRLDGPGMGLEGSNGEGAGLFVAGDPIPGIPIIIAKDTASLSTGQPIFTPIAMRITSDSPNINERGFYDFNDLGPGDYRIHVDMPGLPMAETYFFTIGVDALVFESLDFFADTTDAIYITDTESIGIHNRTVSEKIKAFPNPFSGILTIELPVEQDATGMNVWFCDLAGRRVRPTMISVNKHRIIIDAGNLPAGYYVLQAKAPFATFQTGVIKQ